MRQKSGPQESAEQHMETIRRVTRKKYSTEEKIRVVLSGLRGEYSVAELCRREGIAESLYYSWSKEFLEAGKRRLAGGSALSAVGSILPNSIDESPRPTNGSTGSTMPSKPGWPIWTIRPSRSVSPG
jgi:transposase